MSLPRWSVFLFLDVLTWDYYSAGRLTRNIFVSNLCRDNSTNVSTSMVNVFIFRCADLGLLLCRPIDTEYFSQLSLRLIPQAESPPASYHLCRICDSKKKKALKIKKYNFSAILCTLLQSKFWHFQEEKIL